MNILPLSADADYEELTNYLLTFNSSTTIITVSVGIVVTNDSIAEEDEEFIASLSFFGEPIPRVILDPDNATVAIFEIIGEGMKKFICLSNHFSTSACIFF